MVERKNSRAATFGRRLFLGGGAVVLGLPFLESLSSKPALAADTTRKRLLYYFVPNGIHMPAFRPTATGAGYPMPPMLTSLESLRDHFSVVTGLENRSARPDGPGDHASGIGSFLTCAHALKSETNIFVGISADQIAAQAIGKATRLPSLQLGISGGSTAGDCDNGYSCAYTRNISWAGPSTPLPKIVNPSQVFDELFQGYDPGASQADRDKRRAYKTSVLDHVSRDAADLGKRLGKTDGKKLDEYLTGVRELERRVNDSQSAASCTPGTRPEDTMSFPEKMTIMADLMVLAMQCDATRIITFMFGNGISQQTYPDLGITRGHHDISHHGGNPDNLAQLQKIGTWEVEQFAYLLGKMNAVQEGDDPKSTILYNSSVFFSSDISDGDRHNHNDLPVLLAGHGGGALSPGRHTMYPPDQRQKIGNLLATMLKTVGVDSPVGDSTGALPEV